MRLDRRHPDLRDQLHARDAGIERRARAACRCRSAVPSRAASSRRSTSRRCPRRRTSPSASAGARERSDSRSHMKREAGRAEQVLDGPAGDDVGAERAHVELERADRLVAVGEHERAVRVRELGDRGHVVAVARAERDGRAADERRPLVDRLGEALERDRARPPRAGRARPRRRAAPARARSARRSGTRTR